MSPEFLILPRFVIGPTSAVSIIPASQGCIWRYPTSEASTSLWTQTPIEDADQKALKKEVRSEMGVHCLSPTLQDTYRISMACQGFGVYVHREQESEIIQRRAATAQREREEALAAQKAQQDAYEAIRKDVSAPMLHSPLERRYSASKRLSKRLNAILIGAWKRTVKGKTNAYVRDWVVGQTLVAERRYGTISSEYDAEDYYEPRRVFWSHFPKGWYYEYESAQQRKLEDYPNKYVQRYLGPK